MKIIITENERKSISSQHEEFDSRILNFLMRRIKVEERKLGGDFGDFEDLKDMFINDYLRHRITQRATTAKDSADVNEACHIVFEKCLINLIVQKKGRVTTEEKGGKVEIWVEALE